MNLSSVFKFPVVFHKEEDNYEILDKLPDEDVCYLVASNGLFLSKNFVWGKGLIKVSTLPFLKEISEEQQKIRWRLPKIPSIHLSNCVSFFCKVYELYHSEAVVLIYYNPNNSIWFFEPPSQRVYRSGVKYIIPETKKDMILVGSISSRAAKPAYFSLQDLNDEENFEGLHVVIGNIHKDTKSSKCCLVMNNNFDDIDINQIFDDVNPLFQLCETKDDLANNWLSNVLTEN